jgi:hypothetical protein
MRFSACQRAMALCTGDDLGSWLDLCNHDTVDELSEIFTMHGLGESSAAICIFELRTEAKYSFVLSVKEICSLSVKR